MNNTTKIALLIAVGVILVGCSSDNDPSAKEKPLWEDPFFPRDDVTPPSRLMFDRQVANGAAADAMLFDIHFDGGELNSLGKQKLGLIIKGRSTNVPTKVYLNMPKDAEYSTARQTTVESVLGSAGLAKEQFAVVFGPNPGVLMPADAGIRALQPVGAGPSGAMGGTAVDAAAADGK